MRAIRKQSTNSTVAHTGFRASWCVGQLGWKTCQFSAEVMNGKSPELHTHMVVEVLGYLRSRCRWNRDCHCGVLDCRGN